MLWRLWIFRDGGSESFCAQVKGGSVERRAMTRRCQSTLFISHCGCLLPSTHTHHAVWPDVKIKSNPNCSISCPISSYNSFYLKRMFFKVSQKVIIYLGNWLRKNKAPRTLKTAQSGHTAHMCAYLPSTYLLRARELWETSSVRHIQNTFASVSLPRTQAGIYTLTMAFTLVRPSRLSSIMA